MNKSTLNVAPTTNKYGIEWDEYIILLCICILKCYIIEPIKYNVPPNLKNEQTSMFTSAHARTFFVKSSFHYGTIIQF